MTKEEAIKWLGNLTQDIGQMRHQDLWGYAQAITEIGQMIADTPEIVRCKDCKYRGEHAGADFWICEQNGIPFKVNDFCSYGERRESE